MDETVVNFLQQMSKNHQNSAEDKKRWVVKGKIDLVEIESTVKALPGTEVKQKCWAEPERKSWRKRQNLDKDCSCSAIKSDKHVVCHLKSLIEH